MDDQLNCTHANHYDILLSLSIPPESNKTPLQNTIPSNNRFRNGPRIVAIEQDDDADSTTLFGGNYGANRNDALSDIAENESNEILFRASSLMEDDDVIPGPPASLHTGVRNGISRSNPSYHTNRSNGSKKNAINTSNHTTNSGGSNKSKAVVLLRNVFSKSKSTASKSGSSTLEYNDDEIPRPPTCTIENFQDHENDQLEISTTEHDPTRWAGDGLLANNADLLIPREQFIAGCHLLHSCALGDLTAVKNILDDPQHLANVNFRDYDRRTALHVAASEGHLAVCELLVERGAKVNRSDRWGGSPLDDARRHRHRVVIDFLRKLGGTTGSGNRFINLITAAADGDIDEIRLLLRQYKKTEMQVSFVNRKDYDHRTALHLAAGEGHTDVVRELCIAGGDVNAEDRWKRRPLDDAVAGCHSETAEVLRSFGASPGLGSDVTGSRGGVRDNNEITPKDPLDTSTMKRFIDDNMHVEFHELEMIDRIGSGAFGEIYKCRWRGTLVAAKIIKTAKIQKEWLNRKLTNDIMKKNGTVDEIEDAIHALDAAADEGQRNRSKDGNIEAISGSKSSPQEQEDTERDLAVADFRQEISVLRSLRHPNIVLLLAYSTSHDYECLISELMKCSLLDVFKSHLVQGTRMAKRTQLAYATQLAQGMNYLHTCRPPIIHRDLKPANLLIDHHSGVLKISDFGLSKIRPDPHKNATGIDKFVMTGETGSYRFMAPEVYRHEKYNETVDVYSYSMILYYLFVGKPPWSTLPGDVAVRKAAEEGDRPILPRDMDHRLQELIKECWDDNIALRPPFLDILKCLAEYGHSVFHHDSNNVVVSEAPGEYRRCCTIM